MPRMAARVFAYALADDAERYTAAAFAEGLRVSPAAVSGAVRYLLDTRMIVKEHEPGTRATSYRIYEDDVWTAIMTARLPMLACGRTVAEAADLVGRTTGAAGGSARPRPTSGSAARRRRR